MFLEELGWNGFFAQQLTEASVVGRIAAQNRGHFLVWTAEGEIEATVSGRHRHSSLPWPCVGDWVVLRENAAVIDLVLSPRTRLSRKRPGKGPREQVLAANIDALFIVSGLDRDYNPRRIERYLVLAEESGARPVILLNKTDLVDEFAIDLNRVVHEAGQLGRAPVVAVSALNGSGLDAIPALLAPGETAALIGSSGAGKSTILNRLLGEDRQRTSAVRADDQRGRHTTTSRELFLMPGGWLLMDLPGLRELQLWVDPEQVDGSFDDIQRLAEGCRFRDCTHLSEPGCAVRAAGLDSGRIANYHKLQREVAYLDRKHDPLAAMQQKRKLKRIMHAHEKFQRRKPES
jgi:ribosome biogenesis GTPase / thiamine phosphate phosphatase